MYRKSVNKRKSTKRFSRGAARTKSVNLRPGLARGGFRL